MRQKSQILAMTLSALLVALPAQAQEQKPTLNAFINHVLQVSPAIASAEARVAAAKANQKAASRWRYNPEIAFDFEDIDGEDKTNILGLNQTIDWNGKYKASGKTAQFELQTVQAERDDTRQTTALDVLSALANYRSAKDIFDLAVERSGLMERFSELAGNSFNAGDIDQGEYNLAQLALSEAVIAQADAETTLAQRKQDLDTSVGFALADDLVLPSLPENLPDVPVSQNEVQILTQLPRLRALKNSEEAAKSAILGARKDRISDPTIGIASGKDSGADMVGFSVSVPLNIFNSFSAEVDVAKQQALAEAKSRQNAFHAARTRLKSSQRSYQLSKKAWLNWQKAGAPALAEQVDILDRKFKVGDLSATDYLVQIDQALDTKVASKELYSNVWQTWFSWLDASGTVKQWLQNSGE